MRTNVYIDGFNLFYGLLKGSPHKWLNLEVLFDTVLPKNTVQRIVYCTAMVESRPHDPDLPIRQAAYLRALATLPRVEVVFGTFLSSCSKAPVVERDPKTKDPIIGADGRPVIKRSPTGAPVMEYFYKSEEKGSDVNLAAHLLRDAYRGDCECSVVVSNDSDLLTPLRMVRQDKKMTVGLILPRQKGSLQLKRTANFERQIRTHNLAAAQFPNTLTDAVGTIKRPNGW